MTVSFWTLWSTLLCFCTYKYIYKIKKIALHLPNSLYNWFQVIFSLRIHKNVQVKSVTNRGILWDFVVFSLRTKMKDLSLCSLNVQKENKNQSTLPILTFLKPFSGRCCPWPRSQLYSYWVKPLPRLRLLELYKENNDKLGEDGK